MQTQTPFIVSIVKLLLRGRPRLHVIVVVFALVVMITGAGHSYVPACLWQEELEVVFTIREQEGVVV